MTLLIDVEKLPRNVLETAIKLNDPLKNIYITLYCFGEPTAPKEIAKKLDPQEHTSTCGYANSNPWA